MGKIKKVPTEGGSGGGRGHSNMEHWVYTDEIKCAARTRRRIDDREAVRRWESGGALDLVVLEAFRISGRGVAVLFEDPAPPLYVADRVRVRFHRPDGTIASVTGSVELMLRRPDDERVAVLLRTDAIDDFSAGMELAVERAG